MKMSITTILSLAALLGFAASSAFAAPLSEKQQAAVREEVARAMQNFVAACERADLAGTLAFMADVPEFRYADPEGKLLDYATAKQGLGEWFGQCSAQRVLPQRQEIAVLGIDAALVEWHGALELVLKDGAVLRADPYNASFLFRRMDGAWKIVYQHESGLPPQPVPAHTVTTAGQARAASASDLTQAQQATIKQEVIGTFHGLLAAEERLDAGAVWAVHADVPGYWWADVDGKLYDFAGTKKSWADYYVTCAKLKFTTKQEEVLVLGPDLAFYLWHGAADITGKDGTVSRVDPWTARYLCRRIGGVWKIVGGQESSLPPQPVGQPNTATAPSAEKEHAAISQEVSLAMKGFLAAGERVDLEGVWAFNATTPDYLYADTDGKLFDLAGARKSWSDSFAGFLRAKYTTRQENILVLGPDTAVHVWNGSCACTLKDGAVVNVEPLTFTSVWRRIDGAWKIVRFHESAPPPQPTTPPVGAEAEIRRTDADLVAAANAHDLERWLAFFEPDARLLPPGAPPISGLDAIRRFATTVMQTPGFAVVHNLESVEVARDGQSAWVAYSFALTVRDETGNPVTEKGKDTTLYRKGTDGRWRVLVDAWGKHTPAK